MRTRADFSGIVFVSGALDLRRERAGGCCQAAARLLRQWRITLALEEAAACYIYYRYAATAEAPRQPASQGQQEFGLLAQIEASDPAIRKLTFELPMAARNCFYQVVWSGKDGELRQTAWLPLPLANVTCARAEAAYNVNI